MKYKIGDKFKYLPREGETFIIQRVEHVRNRYLYYGEYYIERNDRTYRNIALDEPTLSNGDYMLYRSLNDIRKEQLQELLG